ncbi:IclR family transcriptional regulator [Novosphingobium sp. CCH12-A3]|uniref:IclR family transcriptional regulator n=1 Tax=Novosphingobium sp. CCH12-A3 TaxID=1768752 RepID=UPI000784E90B|nr:IclR family transcriptional regulator [Novosphingobium sp. CCH12-A3]
MSQGTPPIAALGRSLAMLEAVLADREGRSVAAIGADIGFPRATAHRQVATLVAERFLVRLPGGRLGPGPRLLALLPMADEKQVIVAAAAPMLHRLAAKVGCVVQLGTLENDMVTYRLKTGQGAGDLFTKVGLQLEAYCTGIGKILLANLPEAEREAYLATGPFPALTANTITDPDQLREELMRVRAQGFARDDEEIAKGLACIAVPIKGSDGRISAAISVSRGVPGWVGKGEARILVLLEEAARLIEAAIHGSDPGKLLLQA